LWGSGLGDPVTDNWPDLGTRVTIDGTVRASCVRLTDIPEYIGASTQTEKFVWHWTVSSKRLEGRKTALARLSSNNDARSRSRLSPTGRRTDQIRDGAAGIGALGWNYQVRSIAVGILSAAPAFLRMRFLALLRINHTAAVEASLLGRPTEGEIYVHPQCILPTLPVGMIR
jgi:hypothetical protein